MTRDADLLRRYSQEGSQEAFTELVRRHVDFVYAAARRQCGSEHRAADVTQQVFTDLARKARLLCERDELLGWLFVSTRYAAAKIAREESRRDQREREAFMLNAQDASDGAAPDWEQVRPRIDEALESLEETDRTAILLRVLKGHSFAEVGGVLRMSDEAARKRVERALEKLRLALARRGITSTGAALASVLACESAVAAPAGLAAKVTAGAMAAGGVAPLAGVVQLMTTTKVVAGVAAVAVALSLGSAVYEHRQQLLAESECVRATREDLLEAERLRALKDQVAAVERDEAALARGNVAPDAKPGSPEPVRGAELERGKAFIAAHPEAMELLRNNWRVAQAPFMALLSKTLGLTPEQEKLVAQYRMERAVRGYTSGDWAITVALTDSALPLTPEEDLAWQARLKAALGEEKYAQFPAALVDCGSTLAVRAVVGEIAASTFHTDTPLSTSQADALAGLLLKCDSAYQPGSREFSANTVDWPAVFRESASFLGGAQLDAIKAIWTRTEAAGAMKKQADETVAKGRST